MVRGFSEEVLLQQVRRSEDSGVCSTSSFQCWTDFPPIALSALLTLNFPFQVSFLLFLSTFTNTSSSCR
jgi:hypothetical protein